MKGTIVKCLEELITTRHGKIFWQDALKSAGFTKPVMFLPFDDVDDDLVMKVVAALCQHLQLSLPQLAEQFGEYWVCEYAKRLYPQYYTRYKSARKFLLAMDELHVKMTKTMKNAHPPRFAYQWIDQHTLIMFYESQRNLIDLAIGLAKGVGKYYNEDLQVTKLGINRLKIVFP